MNDTATPAESEDDVVVRFLMGLDAAEDETRFIDEFCRDHPDREPELRDLARARKALQAVKVGAGEAVPKRLGDFINLRWWADGGMGVVYEAVQKPFGRRVAVKTIRALNGSIPDHFQDRFAREQEVLAKLHHSHIVPIHAAGRDEALGLQYYAMEFIDGAPLSRLIHTARTLKADSSNGKTPSLAELAQWATSTTEPSPGARPNLDQPTSSTSSFVSAANTRQAPDDLLSRPLPPFSAKYLRSVATVMADAADALQHAHEAGILHRDLKPSNIMVDRHEHCWVVDFGLARLRPEDGVLWDGTFAGDEDSTRATLTHGTQPGTPRFMAPEAIRGEVDPRTDVWGLGVTFYELLTLRPAFPDPKNIPTTDPPPSRDLVTNLPPDLDAICRKALRKDPSDRYATAADFRDDLRRWLRHEPTAAFPARPVRRALLWARRNKGWAAAILALAVGIMGLGTGGFYSADASWRVADVAKKESRLARRETAAAWKEAVAAAQVAVAAKKARDESLARERALRRENIIQRLQRIRMTRLKNGWFKQMWSLAEAAAEIESDEALQGHAAAGLIQMDARPIKTFPFAASSLVFTPDGRELLLSGADQNTSGGQVTTWDVATNQHETGPVLGAGTLALRPDGSPVLLTSCDFDRAMPKGSRPSRNDLLLFDAKTFRLIRSYGAPLNEDAPIVASTIAPDASLVAALVLEPQDRAVPFAIEDARQTLAVWETDTGRILWTVPTRRALDVTISPDAKLLAVPHADGRITVLSTTRGESIATLAANDLRINCVAFGRDPAHVAGSSDLGWLLAAGDTGGGATVWDLNRKIPRSYARGSDYDVYALAFSPDGMTLASSGRGGTRLWDVQSGRQLLEIHSAEFTIALAFSPDGKRLAISSLYQDGPNPGVKVVELEEGHGIQTLRGLLGQTGIAVFSPDGVLVAAISHDWKVGVWDRRAGRLLHVLSAPHGLVADNVALAFSPDGRQLTCSAGREAVVWDVPTGRELRSVRLPDGLVDTLVYRGPNRLLLFRLETKDEQASPNSGFHPRAYPRVCRIRDLLSDDPRRPLAVIEDFNWHVHCAAANPDGTSFVVDGVHWDQRKTLASSIRVYDSVTGQPRGGPIPSRAEDRWSGWIEFDPTGEVLAYKPDDKIDAMTLLTMPDRVVLGTLPRRVDGLGPRGERWIHLPRGQEGDPYGLYLHDRGQDKPLLRILADMPLGVLKGAFSRDGRHIAWGNPDGSVNVVDLIEVQKRLAGLGLGW